MRMRESRGPGQRQRSEAGIMLVECLVYIGLFALVLGIAYSVFYRGWESEKRFRRNADEIALALKTGEKWRADVRAATGPLRLEQANGEQILHIPQAKGEVTYVFWQNGIWRNGPGQLEAFLLLGPVQTSEMVADQRGQVSAWRWEVELMSRKYRRMVRPLFTFIAVPASGMKTGAAAPLP